MKNMEALSKKFDLMFEKISGMEIKLSNVENRVSGIETKVSGIETRMEGHEEKFDLLAIGINNLNNKFEKLEVDNKKFKRDIRKDLQNTKLEFLDKLLETEKRLIQKLAPIDLVNNHEIRLQKLELKGNI